MKLVFVNHGLQTIGLKLNMRNFHPLEVVGRGSQTQLQVGEKSNNITQRVKTWKTKDCNSYWQLKDQMKYE